METTRRLMIRGTHDLYWSDKMASWVPCGIADDYPVDALGVLSLPRGGRWVPIWL